MFYWPRETVCCCKYCISCCTEETTNAGQLQLGSKVNLSFCNKSRLLSSLIQNFHKHLFNSVTSLFSNSVGFQIVIDTYCCCFECCFYINQARYVPLSFLGMYNLCGPALEGNILWMFNSLGVLVLVLVSMVPKLYCTTGTARLLIACILFLPLSSVLRINPTLLLYSFLIVLSFCFAGYRHFLLHPGICILLPGPILYFCVIIDHYVSC